MKSCLRYKNFESELLTEIMPFIELPESELYAPFLNTIFLVNDINSCAKKTHFLAQIAVESNHFKYQHPSTSNNQSLLCLQNQADSDGYKNYTNKLKFNKNDAMDHIPDYLKIAAWKFAIKQNHRSIPLTEYARSDDFIFITGIINDGFTWYDSKLELLSYIVNTLHMQSCLQLNKAGIYLFENSEAYTHPKLSFAWGLWNDPSLNQIGKTKSQLEAIKGYERFIELDKLAHNKSQPFIKNSSKKYRREIWYGYTDARKLSEQQLHTLKM